MSNSYTYNQSIRSNEELAELVARLAKASRADAIICATESGSLIKQLQRQAEGSSLLAATTDERTYNELMRNNVETLRLPLHAADRYRQMDHILSLALREDKISVGDIVIFTFGRNFYEMAVTLILVIEVDPGMQQQGISDLLKLTDAIKSDVMDAAINIACKIGRAARRGKRLGTIFTLGDSDAVLQNSRQLVHNPVQGHDQKSRKITNPNVHDSLIELAKLDGAFVVRGDGFIRSAGVFLSSPNIEKSDIDLPGGLGARHMAAATITVRTSATAIVISATDGKVRVFSGGKIVMQVDPDVVQRVLYRKVNHISCPTPIETIGSMRLCPW
ncbi:MAG: diadenylate cyclase [Balneolaceae bacterium]|nr:diadenylate cyclase [Balneolaceae bacterium]